MELKIFKFGDDVIDWVCHESEEKAIEFYKDNCGEDCYQGLVDDYGDEAVTQEPMDKVFTFYPDEETPDEDTIENHIKKYCKEPGFFATSEF